MKVKDFCREYDRIFNCAGGVSCGVWCPMGAYKHARLAERKGEALRPALERWARKSLSRKVAGSVFLEMFNMTIGEIQERLKDD